MLALLVLGAVVGAAIGYLYARGRLASMTADLTGQARAAEDAPGPPRTGRPSWSAPPRSGPR